MDLDPDEGSHLKPAGFIKRRYCTVISNQDAEEPKRKLMKTEQTSNAEEPMEQPQNVNQNMQNPSQDRSCRRRSYKKRRYCCPGKRRYKAKSSNRCCSGRYKNSRINLCNRNWARISIHPFINFLRSYRKRFRKDTPPGEIAKRGRCEWRKMSCKTKQKYYEQAKRARIRGYRT